MNDKNNKLDLLKNEHNNEYYLRKNKFEEIKKKKNFFKDNFLINDTIDNLCKKFFKFDNNQLSCIKKIFKLAGRISSKRDFGKSIFIVIQDLDNKIQLYINNNILNNFKDISKLLDIGDLIGIKGKIFKTKTNELSIKCNNIYLLSKCLHPLAEKFHGLINKEIKSKSRHLDLISNRESCNTFKTRFRIISEIRKFLINKKFIEVETPIMQSIPGGAEANPFITKYNLLNTNYYLRIAPELYLKRLLIGGFNRIFEIGKNFRNEGISAYHNPEFTTIELYSTYTDYKYLIKLIQNLIKKLCLNVLNNTKILYKNNLLDFNKKFEIISMVQSIYKFNNIYNLNFNKIDDCILFAKSNNIYINESFSLGKIQYEIFKKTVEKKIIYPTFITEYPIDISPLSKRNKKNNNIAERFELFICGLEIGNGFSELNDPEDQYNRFKKQSKSSKFFDKDYILSMEYGLPPSSGVGIGIDRLIMILTNNYNIRDVILFPIVRYK